MLARAADGRRHSAERFEYPGSAFVRTDAGYQGLYFVESLTDEGAMIVGATLLPSRSRLRIVFRMADGTGFSTTATSIGHSDETGGEQVFRIRFSAPWYQLLARQPR